MTENQFHQTTISQPAFRIYLADNQSDAFVSTNLDVRLKLGKDGEKGFMIRAWEKNYVSITFHHKNLTFIIHLVIMQIMNFLSRSVSDHFCN